MPEFSKKLHSIVRKATYMSHLRAVSIALGLLLLMTPLSVGDNDGDDESEDDDGFEDMGEGLGTVSAWLLGLTLAYFVWKRALPGIRKHLKMTEQKDKLKQLNTWNKKVLPIHTLLGITALITGTVHGLMMDESSFLLWTSIALMGILSVTGGLMRWKWPPREVKKGARLLHMQRLMSAVVVILLLVGHEMV